MEIRRRLLVNVGDIPPIYQKCDYLQTTGGKARIDTGIAGNDTTLQITGDVKEMTFGAYNGFLGNHNGDSLKGWRIIQPVQATYSTILFGTYVNLSTTMTVPSGTWQNLPFRFQFLLRYGYAEITVNGVTTSKTSTDDGRTDNNMHIAIGSRNPNVASGTATHRFYSVKIWRQGALVRDYRPCIRISDNKAGFYDVVNKTFNPSTGTEDFVAGND